MAAGKRNFKKRNKLIKFLMARMFLDICQADTLVFRQLWGESGQSYNIQITKGRRWEQVVLQVWKRAQKVGKNALRDTWTAPCFCFQFLSKSMMSHVTWWEEKLRWISRPSWKACLVSDEHKSDNHQVAVVTFEPLLRDALRVLLVTFEERA